MDIFKKLLGTNDDQHNAISIVKDPFLKDKVSHISIDFWGAFHIPEWQASVSFKNGNTKGSQDFKGYKANEFPRLIKDLEVFLNQLK